MAKRIVLTGGGTAGHVTPHLAILPHLMEKGYEVHYIGTQNGIENQMIRSLEGVTYHAVKSGKLRRYFSLQMIFDIIQAFLYDPDIRHCVPPPFHLSWPQNDYSI